MEINDYIFLSSEGITLQPESESHLAEIENIQVIGISSGTDENDAYKNLIRQNSYLLGTSFEVIFSYSLAKDFEERRKYFDLSKMQIW